MEDEFKELFQLYDYKSAPVSIPICVVIELQEVDSDSWERTEEEDQKEGEEDWAKPDAWRGWQDQKSTDGIVHWGDETEG